MLVEVATALVEVDDFDVVPPIEEDFVVDVVSVDPTDVEILVDVLETLA